MLSLFWGFRLTIWNVNITYEGMEQTSKQVLD
ncbi:hypothetical protein PCZ31_3219 [Clostridioides difficile]|uniref:Mitochondrial division protein 1 n=1 Tax=Myoviridae sp. ct4QN2 TaxID=2825030 RepID=A0A8S5PVC8_9CAUD|nr:hypothetical protein PCZ31_3219 [Clostridioides difficile]DAE10720.1 MAG TPA: Mitochondrial division protein 1 [Myoviridae sp. ct4QN2]